MRRGSETQECTRGRRTYGGVHEAGVHDEGVYEAGVHDEEVHEVGVHDEGVHEAGEN
jgi:hypothetical protein